MLQALVLFLLLSACTGIRPDPRYTKSSDQHELRAEIARRERAGKSRLLRVVDSYLGVPYLWGGTTRKGMDCSAFTRAIFRETYGIELPRTSLEMFRTGEMVGATRALELGDLVFFADTTSGPGVSHVGIYLGQGRFAHASSSKGATITELTHPYFKQRYAGARRVERP